MARDIAACIEKCLHDQHLVCKLRVGTRNEAVEIVRQDLGPVCTTAKVHLLAFGGLRGAELFSEGTGRQPEAGKIDGGEFFLVAKAQSGGDGVAAVQVDNGPGAQVGCVLPVPFGIQIHEHDAAGNDPTVKIFEPSPARVNNLASNPFRGRAFRGKGIGPKRLDGDFTAVYAKTRRNKGPCRCGECLTSGNGLQLGGQGGKYRVDVVCRAHLPGCTQAAVRAGGDGLQVLHHLTGPGLNAQWRQTKKQQRDEEIKDSGSHGVPG